MIQILWISTLLWFVAAEKCDYNMTFICRTKQVSESDMNQCADNNQSVGCEYTFIWKTDLNTQTKLNNLSIISKHVFKNKETTDCRVTNSSFSLTCYSDNCDIDWAKATSHCFKVKCGDKQSDNQTIFHGKEWRCVITLQSNHNGAVIPNVKAEIMEISEPKCIMNQHGKIEYRCNKDDCHREFLKSSEHMVSILEQECKATIFQCGSASLIYLTKQAKSYPYCEYHWKWNGERYALEQPTSHGGHLIEEGTCFKYDYEERHVLCTKNCSNVTLKDIVSTEYCASIIASNQSTRKAISVVFPIILVLISIGVIYVGCCTLCKARKAHSILQQEYQMEFGTHPVTTSGDQGKKRKKGVTEGGKDKKVKKIPSSN